MQKEKKQRSDHVKEIFQNGFHSPIMKLSRWRTATNQSTEVCRASISPPLQGRESGIRSQAPYERRI